jgi:type II secretion system protein J
MRVNPKSEVRIPKSEKAASSRIADCGLRIADFRDADRSADLQSAVSQICNLQGVADSTLAVPGDALPNAIRRYGRLQICATLRRRHAFTLIELILAIGVMAIVLIAINGVFFSAMRLREKTLDAVGESLPTQNALSIMRRDLQGAMPPAADGILSGDFRVGNVMTLGTGQPVDIEMYTTTGAMHDNEPWSEIQKVTYQLRQPENRQQPGRDLFRSVTRNLLSNMSPLPEDQFMLSGVESIQYSCYDGAAWYDTWDSTVTTNLPSAVRVRILMTNPGGGIQKPIEMLIPIDSQSRTNQAAQ